MQTWLRRGSRGIRLKSCCVGGRQFMTREALGQFFDAVTLRYAVEKPSRVDQFSVPILGIESLRRGVRLFVTD